MSWADRVLGDYPQPQDWVGSWSANYGVIYSSCAGTEVGIKRNAILAISHDARTKLYGITEVPTGNSWGKYGGAVKYVMTMWRKTIPMTVSFRFAAKGMESGLDLSVAPDGTMYGLRVIAKKVSRKRVCSTVYSVTGRRNKQ